MKNPYESWKLVALAANFVMVIYVIFLLKEEPLNKTVVFAVLWLFSYMITIGITWKRAEADTLIKVINAKRSNNEFKV
jgi:hypothetical protein